MAEPFIFVLFKLVWQDLLEDIAYDSMKKSWQTLQILIDQNKQHKQVSQDLIVALEKCFNLSLKTIAEKCRDDLIKNSTFTQYRGAKIYKPIENDTDIKNLENKINLLEKQLKQLNTNRLDNSSVIKPDQLHELLIQLSQPNYQHSPEVKQDINNQLFKQAEKDCHVNIFKATIRDQKNGLHKQIFYNFLIVIEPNEQLNRIFNAGTYLILNHVQKKI